MKSCKICIILCALTCLSFDITAQDYVLLKPGDPAPFEGVIIRLSEYRAVRKKVSVGDSLQHTLNVEIKKQADIVAAQMRTIETQSVIILRHENTITDKDSTITKLNENYDKLEKESRRKSWFNSPWFLIPASAAGGALLTKLF